MMKLPLTLRICLALALGTLAAQVGHAAPIAAYTFDGSQYSPVIWDLAPSNAASYLSASDFHNGVGLDGGTIPNTYFYPSGTGNPSGGVGVRSPGTEASAAAAVTGNDYLSFTLTPHWGYMLNLTGLTFDVTCSADFGGKVFVRSSADSFAANLPITPGSSGVLTPALTWANASVDVSALQRLPAATEFRIYVYDNTTQLADVFRFDNVAVEGAVAPKPIAGYTFDSGTLAPTVAWDEVSVGNFTHGAGLTSGLSTSQFYLSVNGNPKDGIGVRCSGTASTADGALSGNDYICFALEPEPGCRMDVTSLVFDVMAHRAQGETQMTDARGFVRSSVDGFSTNLGEFSLDIYDPGTIGWVTKLVDLSTFGDLTTATEFRIYLYDNSVSDGSVFRFDNVMVYGAVLVPEPAALSLGLLGLIGAVAFGRFVGPRKRTGGAV